MLILWLVLAAAALTLEPQPTPLTITEQLSADVQYLYFLRHLQRHELIPWVNQLENVTVLAPVNSAFTDGDIARKDTKESLRRYFTQNFRVGKLGEKDVIYESSFKVGGKPYPLKVSADLESQEYFVNEIGQIALYDQVVKHQRLYIQTIDRLLPVGPTMCEAIAQGELNGHNISFISGLFESIGCNLANSSTVIIPTNECVERLLLPLQRQYYEALGLSLRNLPLKLTKAASKEISHDIRELLRHFQLPGLVGGLNATGFLNTTYGDNIYYVQNQKDVISFNGIETLGNATSMPASDGLVHLVDDPRFFKRLLIPLAQMIPRKALYAMHYSDFVNEVTFRKLGHLIDKPANRTLVVSVTDRDDADDEAEASSFSNKQALLYRFMEAPRENHLLETELCSKRRIGGCFKVKHLEDSFNDVRVVSDPILAEGTFIYEIEDELTPPANFKRTMAELISNGKAVDKDDCLATLGFLEQFDLLLLPDNRKGYSVFLPCGKGSGVKWTDLELVLEYLKAHPPIFKNLLKGLFVEGVVYFDFHQPWRIMRTRRGDALNVTLSHGSIHLNGTKVDVLPNSDVFFSQGVIHVLPQVFFPSDFHISLLDLLKTTETKSPFSMLRLLEAVPPVFESLGLDSDTKSNYLVLAPRPESLQSLNITSSFGRLNELMQNHILPQESTKILLDCLQGKPNTTAIRSNRTASFECKKVGGRTYLETRDHKLSVLAHGCTLGHSHSCVFLVDLPVNLNWLDDNFLHVHIGWISVGIGIILGFVFFGFITTTIAVYFGAQRKVAVATPPFTPAAPTFMRVTSDEETQDFDRGYETDDDMRTEREPLLKLAPRNITGGILQSINRDRHLPNQ